MTLYGMYSWEYNGRDDSDWYTVVYDSEKDTLQRVETGTTRFANALYCGPKIESCTDEIREQARKCNQRRALPFLIEAEHQSVTEPYDELVSGVQVVFSSATKVQAKAVSKCEKCSGTGHWVNPRNASDKRPCFYCKGGQVHGEKLRGANGKPEWIRFPVGTVGEVVEVQAFGSFYRKGYNRPCRSNSRVLVKFADGSTQWIGATHLSLNRAERTPDELLAVWVQRGRDRDFYTPWASAYGAAPI